MMDAAAAGLIGTVIGAVATLVATFVAGWLSTRQAKAAARMSVVRDIMRYRGNQKMLVDPLNEIPLMFGHDDECMRLLRAFRSAVTETARSEALRDLIIHLAKVAKISNKVTHSDITTPLLYAG